MSSKAELIEYRRNRETGEERSVFVLSHYSLVSRTTLEQNFTILKDRHGARAFVEIDDFPANLSEREAALKLANWLQRLSVAIEDNWAKP